MDGFGIVAFMTRQKSDFTTALKNAAREIRKAQAAARAKYKVHVPLEPEIRALEHYIELDAKKDREGIKCRPGERERLDRAREWGRKGGQSKSKPKRESSADNLRKYREKRKQMMAEASLQLPAETTQGTSIQPEPSSPDSHQSAFREKAARLRQLIANLSAEKERLLPEERHVEPALNIAIRDNQNELRAVMEKMTRPEGSAK